MFDFSFAFTGFDELFKNTTGLQDLLISRYLESKKRDVSGMSIENIKEEMRGYINGTGGKDEFINFINNKLMPQFMMKASDNMFRIIQFYKANDSILLWSHYAQEHKGITVGIDFEESDMADGLRSFFYEVIYTDTPSSLPVDCLRDREEIKKNIKFFYTKGKKWEYEREVRLLIPKNACSSESDYGMPIELRSIKQVVLGAKMDPRLKEIIYMILEHFPSQLQVYDSVLDENEYKMNIIPYIRNQSVRAKMISDIGKEQRKAREQNGLLQSL